MVTKAIGGYEGPRPATPGEWPAVAALLVSIFFPSAAEGGPSPERWPMGSRTDERANTLVMFCSGRPVAAIQRFDRDILVRGCRLRVAFIGAVGTHAEHRGKGLASTILAAQLSRCASDGVDFVHISGTQGLYYGAGADHVGAEERFVVPATAASDALRAASADLHVASAEDALTIARIAQGEATRFLRPLGDFAVVLQAGYCAGSHCRFHLVSAGGRPLAWLMLWGEAGEEEVVEVAGERTLVRQGLGLLAARLGRVLPLRLPRGDALGDLLRDEGIAGQVVASDGTVKLVSFAATMAKLRPYFLGQMPEADVAGLLAADAGERYLAWSGSSVLQCDDERSALWTLAGAPPDREAGVTASGSLATLRERCLPLPLPSFVLNMI